MSKNTANSDKPRLKIKQFNLISQFSCLGDKCPNHCCGTWNVNVDNQTVAKYQESAPDLMQYVEKNDSGEGHHLTHNPETSHCSLLQDGGLCKIHRDYGHEMLPEICRHYPRTFRSLEDKVLVTATSSCPEIARLAIFSEDPFRVVDLTVDDFPAYVSNYARADHSGDDMLYVTKRFIKEAARKDISASDIMMRIIRVSFMMDHHQASGWRRVIDGLFENADFVAFPCHENNYVESVEAFELLKFLHDIRIGGVPRWFQMFETAAKRFSNADFSNVISEENPISMLDEVWLEKIKKNRATTKKINWIMKRFIGAEIVRTMFPYAGNGTLIFDRILMIAFLFSCVRLMLIIHADDEGNCPDDETITRIFQTCVRHTAHLSKDLVQYLRDRKMNNIQRLEEAVRIFETAEK